MKINKIETPEIVFKHKIESKIFYENRIGSRTVDIITLNNGKKIYVDTTILRDKVLCKFLSLYDKTGDFIRTVAKSYKDGKLINTRHIDWK